MAAARLWRDAFTRTHPGEQAAQALDGIISSLATHRAEGGLGHVSEVASGDPPHTPGGCPFQAWSLAALIQMERMRAGTAVDARV